MIKKHNNEWKVDIRPEGRNGPRIRKTFSTKSEALRYERYLLSKAEDKPWEIQPKDKRTLNDLVQKWHELHGVGLRDGEARKRKLLALCDSLKNPLARSFTSSDFAAYRSSRLQTVSPNTVNHEHAYLHAVFSELKRLGEWTAPNPLELIRRLKTQQTELTFLNIDQIKTLLECLDAIKGNDAGKVARICLATGARWSEAATLRAEHLQEDRITFGQTKNGKPRTIPVEPELIKLIKKKGRLFTSCYDGFRRGVKASGIELPEGQMTHVLRHTFASHFMMNGGNILTLQKILDHSTLTMTMRYAHLAPDHLEAAVKLNPIARCGQFVDSASTPS